MKIKFSGIHILIFFLALCVITIYVSGLFVDVTRDAAKYALISKELWSSGDFFNLTLFGEPYLQKPPLLFWLSAFSFHLFGVSNVAFKLPLLLSSLTGVYFTYRLAGHLYNRRVGILSAVLLAFSQAFFLYNMDIHTDTLMMPFVILGIWQLSLYLKNPRIKYLLIGAIGIGFAMLAKGPVGMAIVVLAIGGHLIAKRDIKRILDFKWLLLLAVSLIVVSPAIFILFRHFGINGLKFYFWTNNIGRFTGEYVRTGNDVSYYIHTLLYLYFPWSLFFFFASFFEARRIIHKRLQSHDLFIFTGIWILFFVLSLSESKMPNYIYPVIPLMSILTAKWIYYAFRVKSKTTFLLFRFFQTITDLSVIGLIILMFVYLFPSPSFLVVGMVVLLFIIYMFVRIRYQNRQRTLFLSLIAIVGLNLTFCFHIYSYVMDQQAGSIAARDFNRLSGGNDKLYIYDDENFEMLFYANGEVGFIDDKSVLDSIIETESNSWIMLRKEKYEHLGGEISFIDTVVEIRGASLNRGLRYLNPETREENLDQWYLLGKY